MANAFSITTALFDAKIAPSEVPYLRGNIIKMSGYSPLFHNHDANGFHYAYPLVQYKRINGHAALIGINEGSSAILEMLSGEIPEWLNIGKRRVLTGETNIQTRKVEMSCEQTPYVYEIKRWLPLNQYNFGIYLSKKGLVDRITMLESILTGNILSFAKGVNIFFEDSVKCRILQLEQTGSIPYKGVELMSFAARFECNVPLPDFIGLGKSASLGNGIIQRIHKSSQI